MDEDLDPRGEIWYCSCDAFIGQTPGPSCGKTVVILPSGCTACLNTRLMNALDRMEE